MLETHGARGSIGDGGGDEMVDSPITLPSLSVNLTEIDSEICTTSVTEMLTLVVGTTGFTWTLAFRLSLKNRISALLTTLESRQVLNPGWFSASVSAYWRVDLAAERKALNSKQKAFGSLRHWFIRLKKYLASSIFVCSYIGQA
jgi:hypothetical protein